MEVLDLVGAIVTIDAMGCQHKIAENIRAKDADYILALKGNQGQLHEDVKLAFEQKICASKYESCEKTDGGHGRIEKRKCTVTEDVGWLRDRHSNWNSVKSIYSRT